MTQVFLSLGGNFPHTRQLITQACLELSKIVNKMNVSRLYRTSPVEVVDSEYFFTNACLSGETSEKNPYSFFEKIEKVEALLGKEPKAKDQSRPIDIDLLFFGDQQILSPTLQIPHPRWKERLFVLYPLNELAEEIYDPATSSMQNIPSLIHHCKAKTSQTANVVEDL